MTPRILQLLIDEMTISYVFTVVPDEVAYPKEKYFFEWRDMESLDVVGSLDIANFLDVSVFRRTHLQIRYAL
jgi:hypothetical protein